MRELLERAESAYAEDDLPEARDCYRKILLESPDHALATRALGEIDRALAEHFREDMTVSLIVSLRELVEAGRPSRDAVVISRLAAGPMSVRQLREHSHLSSPDLHVVLFRCAADCVVSVRK